MSPASSGHLFSVGRLGWEADCLCPSRDGSGLEFGCGFSVIHSASRLSPSLRLCSALESQGGLLPIYERIKVLILIRKPNSPNPCLKLITKIIFRITCLFLFPWNSKLTQPTISLLRSRNLASSPESSPKRRSEGVTNFREFIWCRDASLMSRMCGSRIQGPAWTSLLLVWCLGRLDVLVLGLVAGVDNSSKFNRVCI